METYQSSHGKMYLKAQLIIKIRVDKPPKFCEQIHRFFLKLHPGFHLAQHPLFTTSFSFTEGVVKLPHEYPGSG